MFFDGVFDFFSENRFAFFISLFLLLLSFYFFNIFALFAFLVIVVQSIAVFVLKKFDKKLVSSMVKAFIPLAVLYSVIIFFAFALTVGFFFGFIIALALVALAIALNVLLLEKFMNSIVHSIIIIVISAFFGFLIWILSVILLTNFFGIEGLFKAFGIEISDLGHSYSLNTY
ncbi:hypothetical protein KKG83_07420 [Candidatus Micrarchaeota archaeon]|nr:hypothetical protein [Candidatus Micrarchaeota archaeon]